MEFRSIDLAMRGQTKISEAILDFLDISIDIDCGKRNLIIDPSIHIMTKIPWGCKFMVIDYMYEMRTKGFIEFGGC